MILSFADDETSNIYHGIKSARARKRLDPILWSIAQRKLDMINKAQKIEDLRVPPNNHLEKLKADLEGCYSIRINNKWRIIFQWNQNQSGVSQVKIVDHH